MRYVMGVDGGGSKTISLVADERGCLLGYGSGGPINTNFCDQETAVESVSQAVRAALYSAGVKSSQIRRLCISAPTEPGVIRRAMAECGIQSVFRASEGETPRWAARFWVDAHIGVTVDAGTGSLARAWSKDGRLASAGGWGPTLGDEGSGYWISLQAMRAVLQAHDGRIQPTYLTQAVMDFYQMTDILDLVFRATQGLVKAEAGRLGVAPDSGNEHQNEVEKNTGGLNFREIANQMTLSRQEVASLCPVVVQAAQQGDWAALEVLRDAGFELGRLGTAVIARLGMEKDEFAVVPFGGVFRAGDFVLGSFTRKITSVAMKASVVVPRFEPVIGALLLAMNDLDLEIHPGVLENLEYTSFNFPVCRILREEA
jgi:N-acetylglucosamine kinase-like BadF-type ATPase